jgi:hypothetical protein
MTAEAARRLGARGHPSLCIEGMNLLADVALGGACQSRHAAVWVPLPGDPAWGLFEVMTLRCEFKPKRKRGTAVGVPVWLEYVQRTPPGGGQPLVVLRAAWSDGCPFPLTAGRMADAFAPLPQGGWKVRADLSTQHEEFLFERSRGFAHWRVSTTVRGTSECNHSHHPSSVQRGIG